MDDLFYGGASQNSEIYRSDYEDTPSVPEPPMDLDGLMLSQAFNNSSQNQFSLTQLNSSQTASNRKSLINPSQNQFNRSQVNSSLSASSRKRASEPYPTQPSSQKVSRQQSSQQVGVITPSSLVRPGRLTRPIFKPPVKPAAAGSNLTGSHDSGYLSASSHTGQMSQLSQPRTPARRSPARAVAAVTPSTRNTPAPAPRLDQRQNIETPYHPLCLTGETPGGSDAGLIKLRPVAEIPSQYRNIFHFPYFNIVQSKVLDDVMYSDKAMVLCAPTGSGKTVLFELAIIRLLVQQQQLPSSHYKAVYVAPMKALCSERYEDWTEKFGPQGLKCKELTGDTELDDYFELQDVHIILTTPEKWDSMTRKWRDNKSLVQMVRLFLVDEVHMLNDETRGATMEAVVSRMKTVESALARSARDTKTEYSGIRFMAVSATVPNVQDVASWLDHESASAVYHSFDDSCRPVRLRKVVLGFPCSESTSEFKFDLSLNYKLAGIIETYSDQKPTLVFCATRKSVQQAASTLVKEAKFIMNSQHKQRLQQKANTLRESKLRDLVLSGVGYHHAGLDLHDRKAIEDLFLKGDLPVLIATSTLAMGVNLPAHLVVIKSTQHYVMGVYQEYTETQVLQMIGRAGRPQFDTSATAVIMTRTSTKRKYDDLLHGNQMVESSLHKNLVEHLNAEIVLETIRDVSVALEWIRSTFLYIRVMKNPKHYGYPEGQSREQIENKLQELCLKNLNSLAGINLVAMGPDGFTLKATETGRLMARYCIAFETMKHFQAVGGAENLNDLLMVLCSSKEFRDVQLRNNEKKTLNTLNKDKNRQTIRFPMEGKIKNNEMKVNCLVQAQLGSLSVQDFALAQDIGKIFRSTVRISRCLLEVHWHRQQFKTLMNAVLLAKCCKAKLWENSKHISRQLTGIGTTLSNALVNAGLITFQKIEETNPREIELIVNRHPPFGNQVRDAVSHLPKYELCIDQTTTYREHKAEVTITVSMTNKELVAEKSSVGPTHTCVLLVGDADNSIVYKAKISDAFLLKNDQWFRRVEVQRSSIGEELSVNLISQDLVGLDVQSTYTPFYTGPKKIQRTAVPPPASQALASEKVRTQSDTIQREPQMLGPNRRPCSHLCNNKNSCSHECCKNGVLIRSTNPRASMMDTLRRELKQKKDQLPKTPLRPLKFDNKQSVESQGLQQYAFKPNQDRMPSSTTKNKPTAPVPFRPTGSGWENIDLCQQRARGTREWNLPQPHDALMEEIFEVNSSDEELLAANSRWYKEANSQYQGSNEGLHYDDYLPDLVPNSTVVNDKWNRMQALSHPTATLSRYHNSFNDELDPPIEDFSPETSAAYPDDEKTYYSTLNGNSTCMEKPSEKFVEESDIQEYNYPKNKSVNHPLISQRHQVRQVQNRTSASEDRITFDIGYDDLGSSFSEESPGHKTSDDNTSFLNRKENYSVEDGGQPMPMTDRAYPKAQPQGMHGHVRDAALPTDNIPMEPSKFFTTQREISPNRHTENSKSMFDNIFEGIF